MTRIRPITIHDIDRIQELASDPEISATSNLPSPYPSDGASEWFGRVSNGIYEGRQVVFSIIDESKVIGVISLNGITLKSGCCSIDYWIGRPFWGMGHGSRAAGLAVPYCFGVLGLRKIRSACLDINTGSKRVLENNGFSYQSESVYSGPFMDRFADMKVIHYELIRPKVWP